MTVKLGITFALPEWDAVTLRDFAQWRDPELALKGVAALIRMLGAGVSFTDRANRALLGVAGPLSSQGVRRFRLTANPPDQTVLRTGAFAVKLVTATPARFDEIQIGPTLADTTANIQQWLEDEADSFGCFTVQRELDNWTRVTPRIDPPIGGVPTPFASGPSGGGSIWQTQLIQPIAFQEQGYYHLLRTP